MANDSNSIPELFELLLRTPKCAKSKATEVRADVRIGTAPLDAPDGLCFTVGLKRAWLDLDVIGLTMTPGTRYGEPTKANRVAIKEKTATETVTHAEAGAQLKLKAGLTSVDASANLGAGAGTKLKTTSSASSAETASHLRVKARGNSRWEITDYPAKELDGTYLNDDVLCQVASQPGANARTVQLTAQAYQRDLLLHVLKSDRRFALASHNHEKMLKILIGKALSASGSQYGGVINFSVSEADVEG